MVGLVYKFIEYYGLGNVFLALARGKQDPLSPSEMHLPSTSNAFFFFFHPGACGMLPAFPQKM